jgi:hypothetical protein
MKRIIYFLSTVLLIAALYSCAEQFDNIKQYAESETVYVGKYSDNPYVGIGYKRVEIELLGDSVGRAATDDIYLGRATKTIIEYEEADSLRRIVIDSVCSWVNITELTTPKTYIFTIYAEDDLGYKSIPIEALAKPFTDDDFAGIAFPMPHVIPAPSTVEFIWDEVSMGLSSPLFKFVELIYSYTDRDNKEVRARLTASDYPSFNMRHLKPNDSTSLTINCRIIPITESGFIIDTLSLQREFRTKTVMLEDYMNARTLRPIISALINPNNQSEATITLGDKTDHLARTEIRYRRQSDGEYNVILVDNDRSRVLCPDIAHYETIQFRCGYNPPETDDIFFTEWQDYAPFIMKYDTKDWVVVPRTGSLNWGRDGAGSQNIWTGGHPMLILDDDPNSGWHSITESSAPFPQVLVIDMKEPRQVSKVITHGGYWKTVQLYLTDDPAIPGYSPYTVNWNSSIKETDYNNWVSQWTALIPDNTPESWGLPIAQGNTEQKHTFLIPQEPSGRFLILRFPDNNAWTEEWPATYISVLGFEVYSY